MEFYLIQTFTTAARPHFAEALRLVQDTASAEEEAHLTVLSSAAAFARARTARFSAKRRPALCRPDR